ncbi:MAG: M4 family metallopeptidase, partial [Blautia sp.]|nr:M4 family metallopeptidase [Blautia sp.]
MEEGEWTGKVTDIAGEEHTITVPVMHSEETGEWYLGDPDRHIAVADFSAAAYSDTHDLQLVSTEGNEGWDNEDLFMYYNYIRAWDFYADMGWIGPDGEGTDVIILKDLCLPDGTPYENACSIGKVEKWQMFGYTGYSEMSDKSNGLVQALDVLAHEYTHTFTTTVMNANLYENDYGAINEAMSDIMGNITEYICHDTEDTRWLMGENTGSAIRSMSNPARYDQPAYVWDRCYGPHTDNPNDINDRGGVHANSSLLSRIAAGMCLNAGMSYEEAAAFWVTTACGMTPGMDYAQIGALLNWALQASGNNAYAPELNALLKETKLDRTDVPDRLPYGQKLVKLILPDTEAFEDDHWVLLSLQPNINAVTEIGATAIETIVSLFRNKDKMEVLSKTVSGLTERLDLDRTKLDLKCLEGDDEEAILNVIGDVAGFAAGTIISQNVSWRAADTNEIITVMQDAPALHVLMRVGAQGTRLDNLLVLFQGHWFDLSSTITDEFMKEGDEPDYGQLISTVADLAGEFLQAKLEKIGSGQDNEMPKKHKQ